MQTAGSDTANKVVGQNVANLRLERGWSQAQLAEALAKQLGKARIDPTTITRMESGRRPTTVAELACLATIFEVTTSALLESPKAPVSALRFRKAYLRLMNLHAEALAAEKSVKAAVEEIEGMLRDRPDLITELTEEEQRKLDLLGEPF